MDQSRSKVESKSTVVSNSGHISNLLAQLFCFVNSVFVRRLTVFLKRILHRIAIAIRVTAANIGSKLSPRRVRMFFYLLYALLIMPLFWLTRTSFLSRPR